jgi:PHD/YefM family antitoxin component YafN of YafNO toxin-antitoxin module
MNTARENFDGLLAAVIEYCDKVSIATDRGAAILVRAEAWNEMVRVRDNSAYLAMLDRSMQQAAEGRVVTKTIEGLEGLAE